MRVLNQVLAFALEMALLAALGYWGFHAGHKNLEHVNFGIGGPLVVIALWSGLAAPRGSYRLPHVPLMVFKLVLFTLGAVALWARHQHVLAIIFEALSLIHLSMAAVFEQEERLKPDPRYREL